jgi:hypothetical protein
MNFNATPSQRCFGSSTPAAGPHLWARINLDIPNHTVEGWPGRSAVAQRLWKLAETHTPKVCVTHCTQAIMDLGAILCTRSMGGFKRRLRG